MKNFEAIHAIYNGQKNVFAIVIPAQAGILSFKLASGPDKIPAFAGMTS